MSNYISDNLGNLFDRVTGNFVGIIGPGGREHLVVTADVDPITGGITGGLSAGGRNLKTKNTSVHRNGNPFRNNPFVSYPRVTNPEPITATLGPSVATGATINTEYNALISGKREIAMRTDADRATNRALILSVSFGAVGITPVSIYASQLASRPALDVSGNVTSWLTDSGIRLTLDGDWISFVYGDNTSSNSAEIYVDGQEISGSTAGVVSNAISSSNHSPQWITLSFADRRKRTITFVKGQLQAIVIKKDAQISPAPFVGKAMVFGDSNALRALTTGESTKIVRRNVAADALECIGYNVTNAAIGGTGFLNNGAYNASYPNVMDKYLARSDYDPSSYSVVWLFGTGNDVNTITTPNQYATVIEKALSAYPNATIVVTGVYEGFNTSESAAAQNVILKAAITQVASPRVFWVPTDKVNHRNAQAMWFGTGCVAGTTGDGNADLYLGSIASGTGDRHANAAGCAHAANWLAGEFVALGLPSFV